MPCFNHGRFIAESVEAVLNQTVREIELIVVDDNSSDDSHVRLTELASRDRRIKIIRHDRNRGASGARNSGLRLAKGAFVAFCDADDVWEPEKLATQLDLLAEKPEYGLTYSDAAIIDENGTRVGGRFSDDFPPPQQPSGNLFNDLCSRNFINMQTVLIRRERLADGLFFDEQISWVEDWWHWIQLSRRVLFLYSPQPLAKYRVHSRSTAVTEKRGYHQNRFKVFKRILRFCPELSSAQRSETWYHMGRCLQCAGKVRMAREFFWKACATSIHERGAVRQCVRPVARLLWLV
ncbi:glycosyltransferase [Verrucomicrobiota bacterium sgz303538]